jgi:transcriptional regulator, propionate catabolism operon regulatory protein
MITKPYHIGFFASSASLRRRIEKIATTQHDQVVISDSTLEASIIVGKKMEEDGVEVIVSRRGTAFMLRENVNIPVVSLPQSSLDLINSLRRASAISRNIFLPSFRNPISETGMLSELLHIELKQGVYQDRASLREIIRDAFLCGSEVVIGGSATKRAALEFGLSYVEMETSEENITAALENAGSVAESNRRQKAMAEQYRCIIDASSDGIVAVDENGCITAVNRTARTMVKSIAADAVGQPIDRVLPLRASKQMLTFNQAVYDNIESIGNERFLVNYIPVMMGEDNIGGICTFKEISRVLRAESSIRRSLHKGLVARYVMKDLIHECQVMKDLVDTTRRFAKTDSTILVMGETGTGKEVLSQSLHNLSHRQAHPFVSVNCSALPEQLLESELFGYEEGAFTGSKKGGKPGRFELAHNGTLFLDEIDTTPPKVQVKLLRVIQEREIMRIGADRKIPVNVRIIAAASKELGQAMHEGRFREDLFFRLNVLRIMIPALRERKEDIPVLLNHFIRFFSDQNHIEPIRLPEAYLEKLVRYSWPGNVRQLRNFAETLVLNCHLRQSSETMDKVYEELIGFLSIPENRAAQPTPRVEPDLRDFFKRQKNRNEAAFILQALESARYSKSKAARNLGISRTTLWRKMKELRLEESTG